jgi:tetratricopeptide (TPR) repeat protein
MRQAKIWIVRCPDPLVALSITYYNIEERLIHRMLDYPNRRLQRLSPRSPGVTAPGGRISVNRVTDHANRCLLLGYERRGRTMPVGTRDAYLAIGGKQSWDPTGDTCANGILGEGLMANQKQLFILRRGPETWNQWRAGNPAVAIDLRAADLEEADLEEADLREANLAGADLEGANLEKADLRRANLGGANLGGAYLGGTYLEGADLRRANVVGAYLDGAYLTGADLREVDLEGAYHSKAYLAEADYYAQSLNNLALLYHAMGNYPAAESLLREARDILYSPLGEEHPAYATSLYNLALLYHAMGNYPAAASLLLQANDILRKSLGEEHPAYATSLYTLALLYHAMGNDPVAASLLLQARAILRESLSEDHPLKAAIDALDPLALAAAEERAKRDEEVTNPDPALSPSQTKRIAKAIRHHLW